MAMVLAATLTPTQGSEPTAGLLCFACGPRGAADALLNILLFVPLGLLFSTAGRSPAKRVLALAVASLAIEVAQTLIVSRHPNLGDVVFNTIGAAVGVLGARLAPRLVAPTAHSARRLVLIATTAALCTALFTGYVSAPSFPEATYHGQWTPRLGNLEWYRGRVLSATLGPIDVPPWQLPDPQLFSSLLLAETPLEIKALAGPPVESLAPLLSVYDDDHREILLIGPARDDLVLRYRSRAADLRLDQPSFDLPGVLRSVSAGDSISVRLQRTSKAFLLTVNDSRATPIGPTLGSAWKLLIGGERFPLWAKALLDTLWVSVWFLAVGFWGRTRVATLAGTMALTAALFVTPHITSLLPTPPIELGGAVVGLAAGFALQRRIESRSERGFSPSGRP